MNTTARLVLFSALCVSMAGCKSSVPTQPAGVTQPATTVTPPVANTPKNDCEAISDPVLAEDCRFTKKVEAEKKRHNVNPVVKHSPGAIQQP